MTRTVAQDVRGRSRSGKGLRVVFTIFVLAYIFCSSARNFFFFFFNKSKFKGEAERNFPRARASGVG